MNNLIDFPLSPTVTAAASVVGRKESEGPVGRCFDYVDKTDRFGQDTWEKSESEMQRLALDTALSKLPVRNNPEYIFAGDLINQCTASCYGLNSFGAQYIGLFGACSTSVLGLTLASVFVSRGIASSAAAVTSSHNCTAERQFRYPVEYGGQRSPVSQWTATASGAFLIEKEGEGAYITQALCGRLCDSGICDATNMGAAMAPAAADTLSRYFLQSGMKPSDFDRIYTGDLGSEGYALTQMLLSGRGYDISENYEDCGLIIFDREKQDVKAGGSGCGCSAAVLASHILPRLTSGEFRDILLVGTGALMSPLTVNQCQNIMSVAHLIRITKEKGL